MELQNAKSDCESRGSHLVYIETSDEQAYLEPTVDELDDEFWIGIKKDDDGNQVWMDGTDIIFDNYLGNDVNDGGECFRMKEDAVSTDTFGWFDKECDHDYRYICETESSGKSTISPN